MANEQVVPAREEVNRFRSKLTRWEELLIVETQVMPRRAIGPMLSNRRLSDPSMRRIPEPSSARVSRVRP